jgi:hypothetical protein
MPFPHTAQEGSWVLVVPCPEAALLTTIHTLFSTFAFSVSEADMRYFYAVRFYFARTSLKKMSNIEIALARMLVFILRHSRNSWRKRAVMPA